MITNVVMAALLFGSTTGVDAALRDRALRVVRSALATEARWVKVHAAEALLAIDEREAVRRVFDRELAAHGAEPEYRVGIWRVLAQAASAPAQTESWTRKIVDAFLDPHGPDRLHASETLGKLRYRARAPEVGAFELAARGSAGPLAANASWVLATSGQPDAERRLADLLAARDAATRATAAYAVRLMPAPSPDLRNALMNVVAADAGEGLVHASLVAAAFVHAPAGRKASFRAALAADATSGDADMKSEACGALASSGGGDDVPLLARLLDDRNVDVQVAAARAILEIDRRLVRAR